MPKLKTKIHYFPVSPEIPSKLIESGGLVRRVFEQELPDTVCQACGWRGFDSELVKLGERSTACPNCSGANFLSEIEYAVIDDKLCEQLEILTHDITIPLEVGEAITGNIKDHLDEDSYSGFRVFKTSIKRYFEGDFNVSSEGDFSYTPLSDWFGKDTVHVAVSYDGYEALLTINFAVRISEDIT